MSGYPVADERMVKMVAPDGMTVAWAPGGTGNPRITTGEPFNELDGFPISADGAFPRKAILMHSTPGDAGVLIPAKAPEAQARKKLAPIIGKPATNAKRMAMVAIAAHEAENEPDEEPLPEEAMAPAQAPVDDPRITAMEQQMGAMLKLFTSLAPAIQKIGASEAAEAQLPAPVAAPAPVSLVDQFPNATATLAPRQAPAPRVPRPAPKTQPQAVKLPTPVQPDSDAPPLITVGFNFGPMGQMPGEYHDIRITRAHIFLRVDSRYRSPIQYVPPIYDPQSNIDPQPFHLVLPGAGQVYKVYCVEEELIQYGPIYDRILERADTDTDLDALQAELTDQSFIPADEEYEHDPEAFGHDGNTEGV